MDDSLVMFHKLEKELFKNKKFIELLKTFSSAEFKKIKKEEQFANIYKKLDEICCEVMDFDPHIFQVHQMSFAGKDISLDGDNMIIFSSTFSKVNPFLMIEKYFEETRLQQQAQALMTGNKFKDFTDEDFKKISACYATPKASYIDDAMLNSQDPLYIYQPHIIDAREYACKMIEETIKTFNSHYGRNNLVNTYLVFLYNDEHRCYDNSYLERAYTKISEAKKLIDDENQKIDDFLANKVDFKKINEVSDDTLYCLMSPAIEYVYSEGFKYEKDKFREAVLNEYLNRLYASFGFEYKNEIKPQKEGLIMPNMGNAILEFKKLVLNNFDEFALKNNVDKETQKKVRLNIYKDKDGKYVNMFPKKTLECYWQPFNEFTNTYIEKENKKMFAAVEKTFNSESITKTVKRKNYATIDKTKLDRQLERIYDLPIEQIEEKIFDNMKKRVALSIADDTKKGLIKRTMI